MSSALPCAPSAPAIALPRALMERLLRDVQADLADYDGLAELLELQFQGAIRHDAQALQALAERIVALVEQIDTRRQFRLGLLTRLAGGAVPSVQALVAQWPVARRGAVQALWDRLEQAVHDCKARNLRNARLMTEQQSLLDRVLHGSQEPLYAHA